MCVFLWLTAASGVWVRLPALLPSPHCMRVSTATGWRTAGGRPAAPPSRRSTSTTTRPNPSSLIKWLLWSSRTSSSATLFWAPAECVELNIIHLIESVFVCVFIGITADRSFRSMMTFSVQTIKLGGSRTTCLSTIWSRWAGRLFSCTEGESHANRLHFSLSQKKKSQFLFNI